MQTTPVAAAPAAEKAPRATAQQVLGIMRMPSNVRDQRRRALGAPLADRSLSAPAPVPASGVPTRDDRCIA
jgi:hypothetical protein